LRAFEERFGPSGFSSRSFCPAYGLAEATLAVTMTPVSGRWRSIRVGAGAVAQGDVLLKRHGNEHGREIVSAGTPLPGYELRADPERLGSVCLRGPSMCSGYLGGDSPSFVEGGWLETSDLGFLDGEDLYVMGRSDDVLVVAGRNVFAIDVEDALAAVSELRSGRVVALCDDDNGLVVAAELALVSSPSRSDLSRITRTIQASVARRVGVAPERVVFVERGQLPMTSSGKVRRHAVVQAISDDSLPTVSASQ
jgi:fatty-acyl-CoA synthase